MITRGSIAAIGALTLSSIAPAFAQTATVDSAYQRLNVRIRGIIENYLRTDCEVGQEVGSALRAVLAVADTARPYLLAVQKEGPPSAVLAEFQRGLDNTWDARQAFLKTPDARELGQRSYEMMIAITREQYMKEQQAAIQASYRERATLALRAIAGRRR